MITCRLERGCIPVVLAGHFKLLLGAMRLPKPVRIHCHMKSMQLQRRNDCAKRYPSSETYSSIVFTFSHSPLSRSFHKLTLLSPVLTARTLPLMLQLTRHATESKGRTVHCHSPMQQPGQHSERRNARREITYPPDYRSLSSKSAPSCPDSHSQCSFCSESSAPTQRP